MDSFCGSTFWDNNITWYTENPDFTLCFEKTVLAWIPCLFLWIFSPLEVYYLLTSKYKDVPWNWLNVSKFLLIFLAIIHCIADFSYSHYRISENQQVYAVDIYSPVIRFVSLCLLITLVWFNKKKGQRSSGFVCLFWFFSLVFGAPQLRTLMMVSRKQGSQEEDFLMYNYIVFYSVVVVSVILNFFAEPKPLFSKYPETQKMCPEKESSFLSKLTFSWFTPLAWKGYKTPLEHDQLWNLNPEDSAREVVPRFYKYWQYSVREKSEAADATFTKGPESVAFLGNTAKATKNQSSILMPLCKAFGPDFLFAAFLKLLQDLLVFVNPQILKLLIGFVSSDQSMWKGYLYAVLFLAVTMCQTMLLAQYFNRVYLVGMRIRTSLVAAIYKKALKISNSARKETTVGEVVNLMSVDVHRFMDLVPHLNMVWSAPLLITLSLYFLWQILGPSVLAGLAIMILLIPVNGVVASRIQRLQVKQMKYKDERAKLMNEVLSGIKVLKLYAWEPSFEQQVLKIRDKEKKVLKQAAYLNSVTVYIWSCAPFFVTLVTFGIYVLSDKSHILDSQTAFVSLSLFNILRIPLSMFPMLIMMMVQTGVSVKRINKFMNSEELDPNCVQHDQSEIDPVVVKDGTFSWGGTQEEAVALRNINMRVKQSSLVAVVGTVASGKSSLLSAILGEMEKVSGTINTKGSIAYVPQQAWIQNATIKGNIVFGRTLDNRDYTKVVEACALKTDFDILPAGDSTEIGEKGVNLSGGQKQRISLARAVYSNSDLYLLDDPLSAVDSHVGKHIFDNVIGPKGLLKKKTRILVTNAITYLPEVDLVIVLKNGQISESGTYDELVAQKGAFAEFLTQYLNEAGKEEEVEDEKAQIGTAEGLRKRTRQTSRDSESSTHSDNRKSTEITAHDSSQQQNHATSKPGDKLIEAEKAETGGVKLDIYLHYIKSIGITIVLTKIVFSLLFQLFTISSNVWLSYWSTDKTSVINGTQDTSKRDMYLSVYLGLGLGQGVVQFFADLVLRLGMLIASHRLHGLILHSVLFAPLAFTDTTPIGRILSRFSKDIDVLDNQFQSEVTEFVYCFFELLGTLAVITFTTPLFVVVIVPIGVVYFIIQRFYVASTRQLKRLESISRSPIYSHFGESVTGAVSIRAYGVQERFITESEQKVDYNHMAFYPSLVAVRWLAVRLESIGNLIIFFAALFAVLARDSVNPGLVGLSIAYSLQVTLVLNVLVRMMSEVEANIVSVERIREYEETPQEAAWEVSPGPPASWPDKGQVEFKNYQVRYREGLDLVLKGVTFTVHGGEKVGIVGRTGAGKSSLTLCLFRILEAAGGQITIDGVDISKLGLNDLRSRLTIIPQDPVLFSGSLRMNLDPFNKEKDESIWNVLELAHLKTYVTGLKAGLQHQVTEGGDNLSVGQRQLVCLARALLRKTKVLILDEATAAVDLETDDLIQQTIKSQFRDCTVLTIAHRLNTIMDYDKVIVLDQGLLKEFDSPTNLLKDKTSIFYSMAKDANLV